MAEPSPSSPTSTPAPRWAWWIATGLGSGWMKPAPGTWGSLAALLVWMLIVAGLAPPFLSWGYWTLEALYLVLPVLMTTLAIRSATHVGRETGLKDDPRIVADEWAGMFIALWPVRGLVPLHLGRLPEPGSWRVLTLLLLPFLLFRLFDIWKPWPIGQIQCLAEGEGVVADDVVAGLYALVGTQALLPLFLQILG